MWHQFGMMSWVVPPANHIRGCLSPTLPPFRPSRDVAANIKMKRINSPAGDNIPIDIFILLFSILLLSFLATAEFKPQSAKPEQ